MKERKIIILLGILLIIAILIITTIIVLLKNTNKTVAQLLRNAMYKVTGSETFQVNASHGGIVTINGK